MVERRYTAGNCLEILKGCRDYLDLKKAFSKKILEQYEKQLAEYLEMEEITDAYLYQVPRVVCWYEGIIPTKDFIKEYGGCM
ncbi:hypothetical protein LAD12857_19660 [Lacrimispora amygdalina]|uniref:Uncharacterized protein n=1 Tax=Lacrimispora amygdalina TaxID=253257 RepID=A0ABQ5M522_9FIRM